MQRAVRRVLGVIIVGAVIVSTVVADEPASLVARLGSPDLVVARAALDEAVRMGPAGVPGLREILQGDDRLARQYAAVALGRINAPGADHALLSCLEDWDDPYLSQFAGEALAARGQAALSLLEEAVGADDASIGAESFETRYYVGDWLGALPRPLEDQVLLKVAARPQMYLAGVPGLFGLDEGEQGMRRWAVHFSADIAFPSNAEATRSWRQVTDEDDRYAVDEMAERWDLLGPMQPDSYEIELWESSPTYLPGLCWKLLKAPDPRQRYWAGWHLLRLLPRGDSDPPDPDRIKLLRAILRDEHFMIQSLVEGDGHLNLQGNAAPLRDELRACLKHEAEPIRAMAAGSLIEIGDPEGLVFAARELPDACYATANALVGGIWWASDKLSNEQKMSLLPSLIAWMRRHVVGGYVVNMLGTMPPQAIPAISEMLDDPELEVRRDTACILGRIGDRSAVPTLEKLLSDPDGRIRINALGALGSILRADVAPYLDRFLASDDPDDRQAAYQAAYNAEDVVLMARVFRRIPEVFSPASMDYLLETWWGPIRQFVGSVGPPGEEDSKPDRAVLDPLLAAARDVFEDAGVSREAKFNAAWLILWHDQQVTPPDDEEAWPRSYPALPDGLLACMITVLRNLDLWPQWTSMEIETEIGRARTLAAVPALQAAISSGSYFGDPRAEALAHTDPNGVNALLGLARSEEDDVAEPAVRALLAAGVQAALQPALDLYREGRLRLSPGLLDQMDETTAKQAVLGAIVTDPTKATYEDLRTLAWADEERGLALARAVLRVRTGPSERMWAVSLLGRKGSAADLPLLRQVAADDLDRYWLRYRALRAIETTRPVEARAIARRWTHDRRYGMRHLGVLVLRGEEQMYL